MREKEALQRIKGAVAQEVEDKRIPSISYIIVDRDGTLVEEHVVREDLATPLSADSVFRVGSCSKMFTTLSLMQLVERGLVDIDVDVSEYIPGFKPINPFSKQDAVVSLRRLMSHTAGIVREPQSGHYLDDSSPSLERIVDELKGSTLKEDPSANVFRYSNAGIAVVGRVVELVSGVPFTDYVDEQILSPLGMKHSSFLRTDFVKEHLAPADMWSMKGDEPAPVFDMGGAPAGNLFSTTEDMALFVRMLLRGGFSSEGEPIVRPSTLREMWTPIGRRGDAWYGLGFGIGTVDHWLTVGHGGAVYGFATQTIALPEAGIGMVLFSTLDASNLIISRLAKHAFQLLLASRGMGRVPAPLPTYRDWDDSLLSSLPGFYRDGGAGEVVEVKRRGGDLYLMGDGVPLRLRPKSDSEFIIDGRIFGPGSEYQHLEVGLNAGRDLVWKGKVWTRLEGPPAVDVPESLVGHLGDYGPDFNVTRLFYDAGGLKCLIEYFYTHSLEEISPGVYRMHGLLYEDEQLELGVRGEDGRMGIRIGPMFLARRRAQTESSL